MNTAGVDVQRRAGRALLNTMHGIWSLGAVLSGLVGSAAAALDVSLTVHLAVVCAVCALLVAVTASAIPDVHPPAARGTAGPAPRAWSPHLILLCVFAVLAALVESAPSSWSAVYLSEQTGAGAGLAGLGFTAFMAAMLLTRLVADRVVDRVGAVTVVRCGGVVGAVALAVALMFGGTTLGILAFALLGFGSAAVFPSMFSAAGMLPGQAMQVMNLTSRLGFMAAPALVGAVAELTSLPSAFALILVPATLGLAVLAPAVRLRQQ